MRILDKNEQRATPTLFMSNKQSENKQQSETPSLCAISSMRCAARLSRQLFFTDEFFK